MTEKEVNEIRNRIQKEALLSIENNTTTKGSLLAMATGSGKSKIPILYAQKKKHKVKKIALIVPTERLRDEDWHDEFIKWGAEDIWGNVTRLCYASAHKIKKEEFDLVILDECHNITLLSAEFLAHNTIKKIIALTATPPEDFEKHNILTRAGIILTYHLTLDDAIKLGFVAPYTIEIVYTKLDERNKNVVAGSKDKPFYQTEFANYNWLNNTIIEMEYTGLSHTSRYKNMLLKRMRAIYNLRSKSDVAHKYILRERMEDNRVLVFCGSIEQAEYLSPNYYHSKSGKGSLELFIDKKVDVLSCVKALNEGSNLPEIDTAIIVQLNSKEKDLIQRIGRLIRYRPGHVAKIIIIIAKDTQDEVWLANAIKGFDKTKIKFTYAN